MSTLVFAVVFVAGASGLVLLIMGMRELRGARAELQDMTARARAREQRLRVQLMRADGVIDQQWRLLEQRSILTVSGVAVESAPRPALVTLSRGDIATRVLVLQEHPEPPANAAWEARLPSEEIGFPRGGRLQLNTSSAAFKRVELVINGTHIVIAAGVVL